MKPTYLAAPILLVFLMLPFISQSVALAAAKTAVDAEPVCVVKHNVKLRKSPEANAAVSWSVPRFMPLLKIGKKKGWIQVQDLEGTSHWTTSNSVSRKVNCAVVRTKIAKLRRGPGYDQPLADLARVEKYTPFKKIDRDGEWVEVKDDYNGTYWIHETNIWIPMQKTSMTF